jgi:DNA invertase Pin-like site-specific DNA recombinase
MRKLRSINKCLILAWGHNVLIGYARVSTNEQTLDLQLDALTKAGCEEIRQDKISSVADDRPGLKSVLEIVRAGDTLVVWRLDRLGRSLKQLIELINELQNRGVCFRSVTESIDTTTTGGKLVFHIFGALAEFERNLIKERTNAGLEAARARGRKGGRPKAISDPKKLNLIYSMYDDKGQYSIGDILSTFHISRATLYKYLGKREPRTTIPN